MNRFPTLVNRELSDVQERFAYLYEKSLVGASASISSVFSAGLILERGRPLVPLFLALFVGSQILGLWADRDGHVSYLSHLGVSFLGFCFDLAKVLTLMIVYRVLQLALFPRWFSVACV